MALRPVDTGLPVLFTHVPKTGGSTITGGMSIIFGHGNTAGISTAKPDVRAAFLEQSKADGKPYVYGHFRYSDAAKVYDKANYIVALRDPLDRILSFYFMFLRANPRSELADRCAQDVAGDGFKLYHDWLVTRRRQDNLMCRYLCEEPDHKAAIARLEESYCLAWDNKGADLAWQYLHLQLRQREAPTASLRRRNDAPVAEDSADFTSGARPKDYATFLPPEHRAMVEERNAEDFALYRWFQENSVDSVPVRTDTTVATGQQA
ncbi:sulfotransferase family 2 domain-containing protein [Sphingomonas sabuli]|uniref:Sulfotransferase family 2 domain-containing protein n=1 Tax=Sphingomonas sabuli TaxID=2764186 RepID=A0A7G9L5A0_9SPHN|nr:sulfotransferase family 2 domain-containing protein [Sphingomonas sabuli]QNM83799.1 sulfotransferase family 2 domain-containing protein [Sphingomonas sabuli]